MGETRRNAQTAESGKLVNPWEEIFDAIYEDYNFLAAEHVDTVFNVIRVITERPETRIQEAMNILEDARRILLAYRTVS